MLTEESILSKIDHPFLANLYCTLETPSHLHFLLQICSGGELYGLLNAQPKKRLKEVNLDKPDPMPPSALACVCARVCMRETDRQTKRD